MLRQQNCDFVTVQFKDLINFETIMLKRYHRIQKYIVSVVILSEHSDTLSAHNSFIVRHILSLKNMLWSKIIDYLSIEDLCSVAETCVQLKQLSELVFSSNFDKMTVRAHDYNALKAFSIFGHLITELNVDLIEPPNIFLNFIADMCGKKLLRLSLYMNAKNGSHLDNNTKKKLMQMFSKLQHLEIHCHGFFDLSTTMDLLLSCLALESLTLNCISTSNTIWNEINVRLPQLKELKFHINLAINDKGLENWLTNNSNIKSLYVDECTNLTSYALDIIVHRLPILEKLTLGMLQNCHTENRMQLGKLKIQSLGLLLGTALPTMNVIYEAGIPVESLELWYVHVNNAHIERLSSMKTIRELTIFSYTTKNSHLKMIADNLPQLTKLTLGHSLHVTVDGVEDMLLISKQLSSLHLFAMNNIDRCRLRRFVTQHLGLPVSIVFE